MAPVKAENVNIDICDKDDTKIPITDYGAKPTIDVEEDADENQSFINKGDAEGNRPIVVADDLKPETNAETPDDQLSSTTEATRTNCTEEDSDSQASSNGSGIFGFKNLEWLLNLSRFKMKPGLRKVTFRRLGEMLVGNLLLLVTFSGVTVGFIAGLALRSADLDTETINYIAYPGELFMRLLKLMILPLIIASLITGAASLNAKMNGMIAIRTIVYFLTTSLISACLGLALVVLIHPGSSETKDLLGSGNTADRKVDIVDNFLDLGRNLFPDNLFQASFQTAYTKYSLVDNNDNGTSSEYQRQVAYRSGTNTLGIIFFCLSFGTVLGSLGKSGKPVVDFFKIIDEVIMKMVYAIMWISPIGISSVICAKILSVANLQVVMSQLGLFIITVVSGVFIYQLTILQLIYFVFVKKNPLKFWMGCFQAWMTAFATASTAAALPVSFRCMQDNNKVDPRISKFVLPIGATVNMDGTALFVTVASIFIAQMNSIEMDAVKLATVVLTATATSIAAASVPSAALVLMLIVLTAIDCPYEDVSLLWAIDWFVDRCRTTNNLLGDMYGAAVVEALSKSELKAMDEEIKKEAKFDKDGTIDADLEKLGADDDLDKVESGMEKPEMFSTPRMSLSAAAVGSIAPNKEDEEDLDVVITKH